MMIRFSDDHVWVRVEGNTGVVGITHYAQDTLGDVVFVDLPEIGMSVDARSVAGAVESVKAAADVYAPVSGVIAEVNEALRADPSLVNSSPLEAGWLYKVQLAEPAELEALMDEDTYRSSLLA